MNQSVFVVSSDWGSRTVSAACFKTRKEAEESIDYTES